MNNIILSLVSGLIILLGTLGAVLPFLPGIPLSYAGLVLYAIFTKFESVGVTGLVVFGILTLITIVLDFLAPAIAAKGYKSTKMGSTGAVIGAFLGIFVLGPIGALIGPFIGAFIGELMAHANSDRAFRVATAAFIGFVLGSVFKLIVGVTMFVYFLIAVL